MWPSPSCTSGLPDESRVQQHTCAYLAGGALRFQYGQEEDGWFFECDVRKNIVRETPADADGTENVASFRCYVSRPHAPRDQFEHSILAVEMAARMCKDQDMILDSANKYAPIFGDAVHEYTWDELMRIGDPKSALHTLLDPRFMAWKDAFDLEWSGFKYPVAEIVPIATRDKDLPIYPMRDVGVVKVEAGEFVKLKWRACVDGSRGKEDPHACFSPALGVETQKFFFAARYMLRGCVFSPNSCSRMCRRDIHGRSH